MTTTTEYTREHKDYLDMLRESGVINMFGAGEHLQDRFDITRYDATRILAQWMEEFTEESDE